MPNKSFFRHCTFAFPAGNFAKSLRGKYFTKCIQNNYDARTVSLKRRVGIGKRPQHPSSPQLFLQFNSLNLSIACSPSGLYFPRQKSTIIQPLRTENLAPPRLANEVYCGFWIRPTDRLKPLTRKFQIIASSN